MRTFCLYLVLGLLSLQACSAPLPTAQTATIGAIGAGLARRGNGVPAGAPDLDAPAPPAEPVRIPQFQAGDDLGAVNARLGAAAEGLGVAGTQDAQDLLDATRRVVQHFAPAEGRYFLTAEDAGGFNKALRYLAKMGRA